MAADEIVELAAGVGDLAFAAERLLGGTVRQVELDVFSHQVALQTRAVDLLEPFERRGIAAVLGVEPGLGQFGRLIVQE